ncbi:MAG TPA: single-stranded-DNA-specific exonuclease RecJ [Candidatus Saccharimonadia bacterium]|jgi:single-stranded-DNA-specific exonuclease
MTPEVGTTKTRVVPEIVAKILAGRGMAPEDMATFLYPDYERDTHDPMLMTDMAAAVERIVLAAQRGESTVVYGDYDIDGITASAVVLEAFAAIGLPARSYIPDRFEEGYGINQQALEKLKGEGVQLVVSVDCGITSVNEAKWAREHGLDLVITDHHSVPEVIPGAVAVVNPKRPGDHYPFKELAGVGVAFKLVQALQRRLGRPELGQEKWLLDLVALGTVCDVVPLVGENRALAAFGLKVMRKTRRLGLRSLAAVGGADITKITAHHLGFVLGPRMNAAGRLEHAARSLELMQTADGGRALEIAQELDAMNRRRRSEQDAIFKAAHTLAEQYADQPVLVLADPDWSHGVVGIVASKLVEKWHKPVLVGQVLGEQAKGSARSVGGFNMVEALRANAELLTKFGGHFYAAGFTLPTERLDDFRAGMCRYFEDSRAGDYEVPEMAADIQLEGLDGVGWPLLEELDLLEPFGNSNPRPILELGGLSVSECSRIGVDGKHLRIKFSDNKGGHLAGIGFGLSEQFLDLRAGQLLTVRGGLSKNEYLGSASLQVQISDLIL